MGKRILFINRKAPHGTAYAGEQLQMAMIFGAFEQQVSMLFINDGVYALRAHQETSAIGFRNFSRTYASLEKYYGISCIYADDRSLKQRELMQEDLVISVKTLNESAVRELMQAQDFILSV